MSDNRTIAEVLKAVNAAVDRARKGRVISALREGADLLEKDPRPFKEATRAIFSELIAALAEREWSMPSDDEVAHEAREMAREARGLLKGDL